MSATRKNPREDFGRGGRE